MQVVGVEVFVCRRRREEKVEELKDQELKSGFIWDVGVSNG